MARRNGFSFTAGPTVRISFPPAASLVRTCLLRNAEETEDHGTVYETRTKKMREQIAAMKEIWTKDKPEHHGEFVSFPPMMTGPSRRRSRIRR
jgi:hypothetical protein